LFLAYPRAFIAAPQSTKYAVASCPRYRRVRYPDERPDGEKEDCQGKTEDAHTKKVEGGTAT